MEKQLTGQRVAVTGGSGFIGRRLVAALIQSGAEVTLLARDRQFSAPAKARVVRVDLSDASGVTAAMAGQDIVMHLAYDVRASGSSNRRAFDAVLAAAEQGGASRFVHASSIVVYDDWLSSDLDERSAITGGSGSSYRRSKIDMEERLMSGALPVAILQPTLVWGPGSKLWTDGLADMLLMGGIVLPEPEGICNGVFVDDVVQGLLAAASLPDLGHERFILNGPGPFAWSDLLSGYVQALGLDPGIVTHSPRSMLEGRLGPASADDSSNESVSLAAHVGGVLRRILGRDRVETLVRGAKQRLARGTPVLPDRHLLGVFGASGFASIETARSRLGYEPQFDLSKGLAVTESHLRRRGGGI